MLIVNYFSMFDFFSIILATKAQNNEEKSQSELLIGLPSFLLHPWIFNLQSS